jgi:hypothetical protein
MADDPARVAPPTARRVVGLAFIDSPDMTTFVHNETMHGRFCTRVVAVNAE